MKYPLIQNHKLKNHLNSLGANIYDAPVPLLPEILKFCSWDFKEFIFIRQYISKRHVSHSFDCVYVSKGSMMAKKEFDWTFIELKLEKADLERMHAFLNDYDDDVMQAVEDVLELGYKVSVSWVSTHNAYCCTVSGNDKTAENNKKSITSWSDSLLEAHAIMAYKTLHVCKGGSWEGHATEAFNWG